MSKVANEKVTLRASYVDWDWSSKHTRLRYQLVISSIIFFLLAVYENSDVRFPFLLIEFDPNYEPTKPLVLLSIGLFYAFTLISFSLRTVNERKLLSPKYEILIDKLTSIDNSFKRLHFGGSGADIKLGGNWGEAGEVFAKLPSFISDIEELEGVLNLQEESQDHQRYSF